MAEIWDLYDVHRDPTGETWARGTKASIPRGRYHLIVSIWTMTPEGRVLITRRHDKKSFGGLWENTGGAVVSGETSIQAAYRELGEEIGLHPGKKELIYLGDIWHPGSIVDTYMYVTDVDLSGLELQPDEVVDAKLATGEEIERIHAAGKMVPSVYKTFCCYKDNMKEVLGVEEI
ncbi:MAG: NUDIX domain-containing protein [Lachnospiraceae bacterium]|nr:NUDIX domain-containing protein [Lachnospiraceae bacterium]